MQANDESGLSGSLNLGHYGVTQSNSFESVKVGGQGAELVTPFAKLQLPYQVCLEPLQEMPKGMRCRTARSFRASYALMRQPPPDTHTVPVCCASDTICRLGNQWQWDPALVSYPYLSDDGCPHNNDSVLSVMMWKSSVRARQEHATP